MHATIKHKEAGPLLVSALQTIKTGHIARIRLTAHHLELATRLADCRRVMAKLAGNRSYGTAMAEPSSDYERGRLCADRRGILAELLVADLLTVAGVDFELQPLISHTTEPGMDLSFNGRVYDIKAAGQYSAEWHPGGQSGRVTNDRNLAVNYKDHCDYLMEEGAAGYIGFYFYMEGGIPVEADVFFYTMEQVSGLTLRGAAPHCDGVNKDMRHYLQPLSFPDARHREEPSPFTAVKEAA